MHRHKGLLVASFSAVFANKNIGNKTVCCGFESATKAIVW